MTLREFLFPSNPPTDVERFVLLIGPRKRHRWWISMWAKLICAVKLFCLLSVLKVFFFLVSFLQANFPSLFSIFNCLLNVISMILLSFNHFEQFSPFWPFCFKLFIVYSFIKFFFTGLKSLFIYLIKLPLLFSFLSVFPACFHFQPRVAQCFHQLSTFLSQLFNFFSSFYSSNILFHQYFFLRFFWAVRFLSSERSSQLSLCRCHMYLCVFQFVVLKTKGKKKALSCRTKHHLVSASFLELTR